MGMEAMLIGTGISAVGSLRAGRQKQEAYEMEARAKKAQAVQVDISAERDIELLTRRYNRTKSAQISAFGRSGVQLSGSPLIQLEETAANAYDDVLAVKTAAAYRKSTLLTEAGFSSVLGSQALDASYFDAAGGILTGIASNPYVYDRRSKGSIGDADYS